MHIDGYQEREREALSLKLPGRSLPLLLTLVSVLLALPRPTAAQPATSSSAQPAPMLPEGYSSQILTPEWRAAFPYRAAFGSLCSLGPLACALIDRPFAFNAHLELVIRPKAPDGSTGVLLPFAVSVPLFGRAEVGLGSCYAGFWASKDDAAKANADPSIKRPSGLCPFWLAGKLLIFPWFRDPHRHPALAVEYLFEYQAGPFSGMNQLGLPGPLSKVSLAYRHPLGRLELSGAASVLVDHISRAGTLQLGGHVGYRLPVGEHFWIFGQVMAQAPSWGPVISAPASGQTLNLAPPVAGTVAIGAQQRADFGFGAGMTLMLTKSELETRVDLLFRLLSFEVGPHIKPLIPAREKKEELPKVAVAVKPQTAPQLECPAGYKVEHVPLRPAPAPGVPNPAPTVPKCVPIPPPYQIPSPLWGKPCYLAPLDGSSALRMGNIDSTGHYCEWDGVRLPLGAVIDPPQRVPHSEPERQSPAAPTSQNPPSGTAPAPTSQTTPGTSASNAHPRRKAHATAVPIAPTPQPPQSSGSPGTPAPRQDRFERVEHVPQSVPGSPFASGFVDGAKKSYHHLRDLYQTIKKHGPGVVIPSAEAVEEWVKEVKEQCVDRLDDCARDKAREAAQALNDFQKKPWEDKKYTLGQWSWSVVEMTAETAAMAAIPGAGAAARAGAKVAEEAALKGAAVAAVRQGTKETVEKAAAKKAAKEVTERAGEAGAKKATEEGVVSEALRQIDDTASATTPVGRRGQQANFPNSMVPRPRNAPGRVGGRDYSGHAFDRMQQRGFSPSVVENAIQHGRPTPGSLPGTLQYVDPANSFSVIVDTATGRVITVF